MQTTCASGRKLLNCRRNHDNSKRHFHCPYNRLIACALGYQKVRNKDIDVIQFSSSLKFLERMKKDKGTRNKQQILVTRFALSVFSAIYIYILLLHSNYVKIWSSFNPLG